MCELENGHTKQNCASNGSIIALVVGNTNKVASVVLEDNGEEVDTMTMDAGEKMFKFELDMESSTANFTGNRNRDNNSNYVALAIMAIIKDDELESQILWDILRRGFFTIIAMYGNGKNRVFGVENGMTAETIEAASGQRYEDLNGATLNFIGKEMKQPPLISTAKVEALLVPVS